VQGGSGRQAGVQVAGCRCSEAGVFCQQGRQRHAAEKAGGRAGRRLQVKVRQRQVAVVNQARGV
jgi:hypothetical protein